MGLKRRFWHLAPWRIKPRRKWNINGICGHVGFKEPKRVYGALRNLILSYHDKEAMQPNCWYVAVSC